MKNILIILLLTISLKAHSKDSIFKPYPVEDWSYSVAYNVLTFHHAVDDYEDDRTGETKDINNDNEFVGVRVNLNQNFGVFVAKGESSVNEPSKMAGIELSQDDKKWELGSDLGVASGYEPIISSGLIPFVNPFLRYNKELTENSKVSVKGGVMNFMAENIFLEYTHKF